MYRQSGSCTCFIDPKSCRAINQQTKAIQSRAGHGLVRRLAEGSRDAGYIEASFRTIANLFDSFQVRELSEDQMHGLKLALDRCGLKHGT